MNFLKLIFFVALFFTSHIAKADNWVLVHTDTKISAYIDKDSIVKVGKFLSARQMLDMHEFRSKLVSKTTYNCRERESSIEDTYLIKPDGSIDQWGKPEHKWSYIPPANNGNSLSLDYVCSKFK